MDLISERISTVTKDDCTNIVILSERTKSKTNLLMLWFVLWTLGGLSVFIYFLTVEDRNTKLTLLVWISFWAYFEFRIYKALVWRIKGMEQIRLQKNKLLYKRIFNSKKKYDTYLLDYIKDVRLIATKEAAFAATMSSSYWTVSGEKIAFDYYGKEIKLGLELEEGDAKKLVKLLNKERMKYQLEE